MRGPTVNRGVTRTADGREVVFHTLGSPHGLPVFYLHGAIGSPLCATGDVAAAANRLGLRLIAPQRPGFGGSTAQPGRGLLDHAEDVRAVADHLRLDRFAVVGVSAGGPYAIACATRLTPRLTAAAVVSGLTPDWTPRALPRRLRVSIGAVRRHPRFAASLGDGLADLARCHPERAARLLSRGAPGSDLADGRSGQVALEAFLSATAGGVAALVDDHLLTLAPWGLPLDEAIGDVRLWHGADDAFVPVAGALEVASRLPHCRVRIAHDEGHFLFRKHAEAILGDLMQTRQVADTSPRAAVRAS